MTHAPQAIALNDPHARSRRLAPRPRGASGSWSAIATRPVVPVPVRLPRWPWASLAGRELVRLFPRAHPPVRSPRRWPASFYASRPTGIRAFAPRLCDSPQRSPWGRCWSSSSSAVLSPRSSSRCTATANPGTPSRGSGTTLLAVGYLGVLPCFFAQIRLLPDPARQLAPRADDLRAEGWRHRARSSPARSSAGTR